MMQILILPFIWRNKEYYAVHLLVANYCVRSKSQIILRRILGFGCGFQIIASAVFFSTIRFSPNGTLDIFEKVNDIDFLIKSLVDIVKKQFQNKDVECSGVDPG